MAQLCVIEINLDLFLRNTLDPHFGHMLDAFDFGLKQSGGIANGGDVIAVGDGKSVEQAINVAEIILDPGWVGAGWQTHGRLGDPSAQLIPDLARVAG